MAMEKHWIDITEQELGQMERRVNKENAALGRQISFLERSVDNCWDYPKAEENNDKYLVRIADANARKELIHSFVESLSKAKQILQQIKENTKNVIS